MIYLERAIKEAIEKGFFAKTHICEDGENRAYASDVLIDPLFWQSLGKARGWAEAEAFKSQKVDGVEMGLHIGFDESVVHWHRFIDHLAEGKDAESFFKMLHG